MDRCIFYTLKLSDCLFAYSDNVKKTVHGRGHDKSWWQVNDNCISSGGKTMVEQLMRKSPPSCPSESKV